MMRRAKSCLGCSVGLLAIMAAGCASNPESQPADPAGSGGTEQTVLSGAGGESANAGAPSAGTPAGGGAQAGANASGSGGEPDGTTATPGALVHVTALPSSACGGTSKPPPDGSNPIDVNGVMRSFVLHVPPGYDGKQAFPLVMAYHGKGDLAVNLDGENFKFKSVGGANNVLVYPQGLPDPKLANNTSFERDPADDLSFIDALLASLKTSVCFDTARVFALGHSLGSTFVQTLACQRGDVLRGIATQGGDPGMMTGCKGSVATWVGYGLMDSSNEITASKARRDYWLAANHCDMNSQTPGAPAPPCLNYGCAAGYPLEWCEEPAGTHKWSPWMTQSIFDFFGAFVSP